MAQINTRIVLRNDTAANWDLVKDTATLMPGEMGVETDTGLFKIGKQHPTEARFCTWAELAYANDIPEVDLSTVTNNIQVIDGTLADAQPGKVEGDMVIVRSVIDGTVKSHTAYVWTETAEGTYDWAAMDGNYNAANVYYDKNIQVTQNVGNVTTENNAPVDLEFKGKNMEQIWQYLYATEDTDLSITQPKSTFTISTSSISQEIGTTFKDPTISLSFADGKYEYGSKDSTGTKYAKNQGAGVLWSAATITGPNNTSIATKTDSSNTTISKIYDLSTNTVVTTATDNVVTEGTTTYSFSSKASCPASIRKPITNLDNFINSANKATSSYEEGTKQTVAITDQAGSASLTVTGWRGWFEGYVATGSELDPANLTSAQVRALAKGSTKGARNGSFSTSISNVPAKTNQIFFACPKGKVKYTLKTGSDTVDTGFSIEQSTPPAPWTIKHTTASVAGADGNNATDYDVFYATDVGTIATQTLTVKYTKA